MTFPFGGHVSPAVTPAEFVWKLPEGADLAAYAGMVLTQVGYNCGIRAPMNPGDLAVVIGDGLGLLRIYLGIHLAGTSL